MGTGQYDALLRAWNQRERRRERRAAAICATLINMNLKPGAQPVSIEDMLPSEDDDA